MRAITLDGLADGVTNAFKHSVDPVDVLVGAGIQKVLGPTIHGKLDEFVYSKVAFLADYPLAKKFLSALATAVAAYALQKGSKRAAGHVVGILGIEAVEVIGEKLRTMLPDSLKGYIDYQNYGELVQDNAYGILQADNSGLAGYGEPTAAGMAQLSRITEYVTEAEPAAEYA